MEPAVKRFNELDTEEKLTAITQIASIEKRTEDDLRESIEQGEDIYYNFLIWDDGSMEIID